MAALTHIVYLIEENVFLLHARKAKFSFKIKDATLALRIAKFASLIQLEAFRVLHAKMVSLIRVENAFKI